LSKDLKRHSRPYRRKNLKMMKSMLNVQILKTFSEIKKISMKNSDLLIT
jgi:hypothetical protein